MLSRLVHQEAKSYSTNFINKGHFQTGVGNSSSRMTPNSESGEYTQMMSAGKDWNTETSKIESKYAYAIWGWSDGSVKLNMGAAGAAITNFANGSGIIAAKSICIGEGISILRAECYGLRYLVELVIAQAKKINQRYGHREHPAFLCIDNETCALCCVGERWSKDNGDILNMIIMLMWKGQQEGITWTILRCGSHIMGSHDNKGNDLADKLAEWGALLAVHIKVQDMTNTLCTKGGIRKILRDGIKVKLSKLDEARGVDNCGWITAMSGSKKKAKSLGSMPRTLSRFIRACLLNRPPWIKPNNKGIDWGRCSMCDGRKPTLEHIFHCSGSQISGDGRKAFTALKRSYRNAMMKLKRGSTQVIKMKWPSKYISLKEVNYMTWKVVKNRSTEETAWKLTPIKRGWWTSEWPHGDVTERKVLFYTIPKYRMKPTYKNMMRNQNDQKANISICGALMKLCYEVKMVKKIPRYLLNEEGPSEGIRTNRTTFSESLVLQIWKKGRMDGAMNSKQSLSTHDC